MAAHFSGSRRRRHVGESGTHLAETNYEHHYQRRRAEELSRRHGFLARWRLLYDDVAFTVNGVLLEDGAMDEDGLAASDKVSIEGGWVYALADGSDRDFEAHFEAWRQRHSTRTLLVQVDASKLDAVLAAIVAAGGSVTAGQ